MSSMTDLIFLLLVFFVLASTMSSPNDIKINLPQARSNDNVPQKLKVAKVFIDNLGTYQLAEGKAPAQEILREDLEAHLLEIQARAAASDSTMYIALHADQDLACREVVYVLDIANQNHMKLVLATNPAASQSK